MFQYLNIQEVTPYAVMRSSGAMVNILASRCDVFLLRAGSCFGKSAPLIFW